MLSIVPVPIGNLRDITLRAVDTLTACDAIVCEDTRVTGKLLTLLTLPKKELISANSYVSPRMLENILERLQRGEHLCLVSDAGTPGISDPGFALVSAARANGIRIEALPGPSAFLTALSVSGLPINKFAYLGFLPLKKGRRTLIASLAEMDQTVVFYESPHRIVRTIGDVCEAMRDQPERPVVIARELTKLHEEIISGSIGTIENLIGTTAIKGEFVVVIGPPPRLRTAGREDLEGI